METMYVLGWKTLRVFLMQFRIEETGKGCHVPEITQEVRRQA